MPEADRLSPGRLPEFVPGMGKDLVQRLSSLPSNDVVLAQALSGRPVVLGVAGHERDVGRTGRALRQAPLRAIGGDPRLFALHFEGTLRSVEEIDRMARGHGLLNVEPERGVVRRMPLVAGAAGAVLPAFGVEMLRVATGAPVLIVRVGPSGIEGVGINDLLIPTESDGSVRVRFGRTDPSRFVSAADVLSGTAELHLFERKLVLIGVTAIGLSDYQATPVAERMSGVEIHAQLLESIFDGDLLSRPRAAGWAEAGVLIAAGLLLVLAVPRLPARPAVALVVPLAEAESQRRALRRSLEQQREQAARVAGELEAARRIQMSSLPQPATAFPGD